MSRRFVVRPEPHSDVYFCIKDTVTKQILRWGLSRKRGWEIATELETELKESEKNENHT